MDTQNSRGKQGNPPWPVVDSPDRRDGLVYVMPQEVELAVEVALATGRPLLLRGEPGSGKSSLAAYLARERGWRYYEHVVTSRTKADDLLWTYDHVRRLSDAQVRDKGTALVDHDYVTPGPLWWAFDPVSAAGGTAGAPRRQDPWARINKGRDPRHSVVLVDEVDKADPDMPNSLLVPLGSHQFTVSDTGERVCRERSSGTGGFGQHLVIITTNEERELPQAFLRRCVIVSLPEPGPDVLVDIAQAHFECYHGSFTRLEKRLARELADALQQARTEARKLAMRAPSTAEFLDALRACKALNIGIEDERWPLLKSLTLLKPQQPGG
ncbi:MoxR family ATPase [Streptomyces sp. NEAU-S7GS2]|uniref:AAA family ATPase n=1 Tax=Streptomyces sp. NEAU-S7GS2 TaxID=2202000 RepID=UPI000D6FCBF1|nr:MoxR family ATPase [Streptomyces sp. NEAU-S7GS2]AWN25955.1 ATPase [Streptomyces sp. NEAU-S7GS2]